MNFRSDSRGRAIGITLSCLVAVGAGGCTPAGRTREWPAVRMNFDRIRRFQRLTLDAGPSYGDNRRFISTFVFGVKGIPTAAPTVSGTPILDYSYKREDLTWYSNSHDYTLFFRRLKDSSTLPNEFQVHVGDQNFTVSKDDYFDPEFPMYASRTPPTRAAGALPIAESDLRWVILMPSKPTAVPPKLEVGLSYAALANVSDQKGLWAGTILAFTPDVVDAKVRIDGRKIAEGRKRVQIVTVGEN